MSYETTADLLGHARQLHEALAARYERLGADSHKEKIRLLLDYLARHERHMAETLSNFSAASAKAVRDAWVRFAPEQEFLACVPPPVDVDAMELGDLVDMAIHLDDCIIDLYQLLALRSELPEAREAFSNLVQLERAEKMKMVRQAMRLDDL